MSEFCCVCREDKLDVATSLKELYECNCRDFIHKSCYDAVPDKSKCIVCNAESKPIPRMSVLSNKFCDLCDWIGVLTSVYVMALIIVISPLFEDIEERNITEEDRKRESKAYYISLAIFAVGTAVLFIFTAILNTFFKKINL